LYNGPFTIQVSINTNRRTASHDGYMTRRSDARDEVAMATDDVCKYSLSGLLNYLELLGCLDLKSKRAWS